ncbi:diguanylate cyclase [Acidithiobacillus sp. IBUN Pt1247-S3]|uniref:diguanylate cyclase domain-containing protein n=1 Tax=Acidithiobacillus sp. IBUN Pt1247-S3 TaxID=3166642 RepID=UPI0034E42F61
MSDSADDSRNDPPSARFWRLLGRGGQSDTNLRRQQQLLAWREALGAILEARRSETELMQRFCDSVLQKQVAAFAAILRPDHEGILQTAALAGSRSILAGVQCSIHADLPEGQGPLGLVWRETRPFYSSRLHNGPALRVWTDRLQRLGISSTAVIPLARLQKGWGVLLLLRHSGDAWPSDEQMLLESTARVLAETLEDVAIYELQATLGAGLRSAFDAVVLTDAKKQVLYVNQSFTLMTGYRSDEIMEKGLALLQGRNTSVQELASLDHALAQESAWTGKLLNYRRDGTDFWNHISIIPVRDAAGVLTNFLGILRDVSREQLLLEQLDYESRHDRLTGLANRRALDDELELAIARAQRNESHLAVCMIDLDHFKPINDLYGHDAGDQVLRAVSRRLRESLRRTDYVARLGGDEFVVLIEGYRNLDELELVLVKIEAGVNAPISLTDGREVAVRLSMGICRVPEDGVQDLANLLRYADQALYRAKSLRGERTKYWVFHQDSRFGLRLEQRAGLLTEREEE